MNQKDQKFDFESSVGPWLGKTVKIVDYYLQESFCAAGLDVTKEQMIILKKLHKRDGLHQNELALLTFRDKSSLARLLAKMENKGYILRKQNNQDKRINEVYLTALGRTIFQKTKPIIQELIQTMEREISDEEIQQTIKILKKIQYNFTAKVASL